MPDVGPLRLVDWLRPPSGLARRYHRSWTVFANWCGAVGHIALPATPLTVAEYLNDNPGTLATQRTRLCAINQAHSVCGLPAPGRAVALRCALNDHRMRRQSRVAARVEEVLPQLPIWGWTGGLFGRRNAAILVLAAAGLTYAQIASLTQGDVSLHGDAAVVGAEWATLVAGSRPEVCAVAALHRWAQVVCVAPRPAGRGLLKHHLTHRSLPQEGLVSDHADLPLFTSFDPRGYTPMDEHRMVWLQPLSMTSIAAIVADHLRGSLPMYRNVGAVHTPRQERLVASPAVVEPVELVDVHAAGVAARRRNHDLLNGIVDLWDDFDAKAARVTKMLADALAAAEE